MYVDPGQFSPDLRQGDILRGRAMLGADLQVQRLVDIGEIAAGDRNASLDFKFKVRSDDFIILSQCCDLNDERALVAQLLPLGAAGINSLDNEKETAFKANQLVAGENPETLGSVLGETPEGEKLHEVRLVLPGYFYLPANPPAMDAERVVAFAMARGIRRDDLKLLAKIAELEPVARMRLRQRLAVFFGRAPDVDIEALAAENR